MKELSELDLPDNLNYSEDHEWAVAEGDTIRIGISDYAQDQLGDIVYVDLPQLGDTFSKGDEFGTVESVKAVSELFMPIAGEVVGVNTNLEESPDLVNKDPYAQGWMVDIRPDDSSEIENLMDKTAYFDMLKGL
jgi:glycine cleavage system H protein